CMPDLEAFSARHGVRIVSIAELITYRLQHERIVRSQQSGEIRPRCLGQGEPFKAYFYSTEVEATEYLALVRGDLAARASAGEPVLVRVQSMCPVDDTFGPRLEVESCLRAIERAGAGVFLFVYNHA